MNASVTRDLDPATRSPGLGHLSAAAAQLAAAIEEITRQISAGRNMADNAMTNALRASELVDGLAERAERIGAVVGLIGTIAQQTNLLALNATIEAARAGEAGHTLAMAAGEVKTLANQAVCAIEDIGGQIAGIQRAARAATVALGDVYTAIERSNGVSCCIAAAIAEQGAATAEIARSARQATLETRGATKIAAAM